MHKYTHDLSCSSGEARPKELHESSGAKPNNTDSFLSFGFSIGNSWVETHKQFYVQKSIK